MADSDTYEFRSYKGLAFEIPRPFNRTGYQFKHWTLRSQDSEESYGEGEEVEFSEDTDLYAQWTANTYKVRFNANGGTGTMNDQPFTYDEEKALASNAFGRTGYTYLGWATSSDDEQAQYSDGQLVGNLTSTNNGIVNLFAIWGINSYLVTFDANGGEGGTSSSQNYGTAIVAPTVTRTGYTFNGWNPSVPSTMPVNGGTYVAQWTANTYQVTFNKQNGTGGSDSVTATYESAMPQATMPTRTGYVFGGYYDGENGTGIQYYNSDGTSARTWDKTSDTTLYAKWSEDNVNVTYHRNFAEQEDDEEEQEN